MKDKTGGNAFPVSWNQNTPGELVTEPGMTLRDYFAAKAMQGMLASGKDLEEEKSPKFGDYIFKAWSLADAMLETRDASTKEG